MRLHFDNSFARLPGHFYTLLDAVPVKQCELVHANKGLAMQLGISPDMLQSPDFADYFGGNQRLPGSEPLATVYAGHQFGYYVPQLGDGRALLLGEVIDSCGGRWDIQLKGAGLTPYSRMADGRAVLRSTIREYLCSEAMHALGIPTTRGLCIVATHEPVYRHVPEPGAVLTRVAESHIRIGHFEYFYYTRQYDAVKQLANYVLTRHYPEQPHNEKGYEYFFEQAVLRTARLIARWQAVGFCHGVMNTDNMSVLGLTIDYGPFGFLDAYDAGHICNSSDDGGRYAFDRQPAIAFWNLMAFAEALTPLLPKETLLRTLDLYQPQLVTAYSDLMHKKMGWQQQQEDDMALVNAMLDLMQQYHLDYTLFLRALSDYTLDGDETRLYSLSCQHEAIKQWLRVYNERSARESTNPEERSQQMRGVNPKYILRNYMAQQAIEAAYEHQDYTEIDRLYQLLQRPFDEQPENNHYAQLPPDWASRLAVSCSS